MRAVATILRARASEHPCNFCEQFEQRPNFASTFKLNETIRYPYKSAPLTSRPHSIALSVLIRIKESILQKLEEKNQMGQERMKESEKGGGGGGAEIRQNFRGKL